MGETPAGWYEDGQGKQRYWDGTQWTDHVQPVEQTEPTEPVQLTGTSESALKTEPAAPSEVDAESAGGVGAEVASTPQQTSTLQHKVYAVGLIAGYVLLVFSLMAPSMPGEVSVALVLLPIVSVVGATTFGARRWGVPVAAWSLHLVTVAIASSLWIANWARYAAGWGHGEWATLTAWWVLYPIVSLLPLVAACWTVPLVRETHGNVSITDTLLRGGRARPSQETGETGSGKAASTRLHTIGLIAGYLVILGGVTKFFFHFPYYLRGKWLWLILVVALALLGTIFLHQLKRLAAARIWLVLLVILAFGEGLISRYCRGLTIAVVNVLQCEGQEGYVWRFSSVFSIPQELVWNWLLTLFIGIILFAATITALVASIKMTPDLLAQREAKIREQREELQRIRHSQRVAQIVEWEAAYRDAHGGEAPPPGTMPPVAQESGWDWRTGYLRSNKFNVMAILAFVFGWNLGPLGVIFGHIALNQIKTTGERGRGLAIAGLIFGYLWLTLILVWVVFIGFILGSLR